MSAVFRVLRTELIRQEFFFIRNNNGVDRDEVESKNKVAVPFIESYAQRNSYDKVPQIKRISDMGKRTGCADIICFDSGCRVVACKIACRMGSERYAGQHQDKARSPQEQSGRSPQKILERNGPYSGGDVDEPAVFKNEF